MVAVIGTLELQDLVLAGVGAGHTQSVKGRLRAGGGVGDFLRARDQLDQLFRQLDSVLVQCTEVVQAMAGLLPDSFDYRRMAVTENVGTGAADVVDIPAAIHRLHPAALTAGDDEAGVLRQ